MKKILLSIFFLPLFLFLSFHSPVKASAYTLSGAVTDNSSVAVPNAAIAVTDSNTNAPIASGTSDASGSYNISLSQGTYDIQVTPSSGSTFTTAIAYSRVISSDTTLNFVLVPAGSVVLSGHLYNAVGQPLSGQTISLLSPNGNFISVQTDNSGSYALPQVSPGTYRLTISGGSNDPSLNIPQTYIIQDFSYTINLSTVLDITLPLKKVSVHVQDNTNNLVSSVSLNATPPGGVISSLSYSFGIGAGALTARLGSSATGTTDAFGNATLWLFPNDSNSPYSITATPPNGTVYTNTNLSNIFITGDTSENITLKQPVTFSGHLYNSLGTPLSSQAVELISPSGSQITTQTDSNGSYSLQTSSGTYFLIISGGSGDPSLDIPDSYTIQSRNGGQPYSYTINQNTNLDITIPFKRVTVHLQDILNNPLNNVVLQAQTVFVSVSNESFPIGTGATGFIGRIGSNDTSTTDASGNATLWLFPNSIPYAIVATPPTGSIYSLFTLSNVFITADQSELISLQFNHTGPVTTAGLSPVADSQGNYQNPTTVTLSSIAASGFSVSNTYYTLDGGNKQTYTVPFTVSGSGSHTITYYSVDNVGIPESLNTKAFTIHTPLPPALSFQFTPNGSNGWFTNSPAAGTVTATTLSTGSTTVSSLTCTGASISNLSGVGTGNVSGTLSVSTQGLTTVSCIATDNLGAQTTEQVIVKLDSTHPTCIAVANPSKIWPPNKKLVNVSETVTPTDLVSGLPSNPFILQSVTNTDAITSADYPGFTIGTPATTGQLRTIRNGAVYTLTYQVTDNAGLTNTCQSTVSVSH